MPKPPLPIVMVLEDALAGWEFAGIPARKPQGRGAPMRKTSGCCSMKARRTRLARSSDTGMLSCYGISVRVDGLQVALRCRQVGGNAAREFAALGESVTTMTPWSGIRVYGEGQRVRELVKPSNSRLFLGFLTGALLFVSEKE